MPNHGEALEPEPTHDLDLIGRHGALAVMHAVRRRPAFRVAIAAQVGRDHGEALGQARRNLVPGEVGLRMAVQQQERRPAPARGEMNARARGLNVVGLRSQGESSQAASPSPPLLAQASPGSIEAGKIVNVGPGTSGHIGALFHHRTGASLTRARGALVSELRLATAPQKARGPEGRASSERALHTTRG